MELSTVYWQLLAGIVLLTVGGDLLVRGSVCVARALNVSRLLIGITLVGFGTSLPELVTSILAAIEGHPGISVGNVVGSNIANLMLVVGIAALIYPLSTPRDSIIRNGGMVAFASILLVLIVFHGFLSRPIGAALVALLILYFIYSYLRDRKLTAANGGTPKGDDDIPETKHLSIYLALLMAFGGVALVILGARWLVDSSIEIARTFNISETVIGLTVVAVGTSLPELVITTIAALRKHTAIGVGNILGSNIQNIFGILGITALVQPIPIPEEILTLDIWVMVGATAAFLIFSATQSRLSRLEGFLLLMGYVGYIALLAYLNLIPAAAY